MIWTKSRGRNLWTALSLFGFFLDQCRAEQGAFSVGFWLDLHQLWAEEGLMESRLFGFENIGGFGLFFLWAFDSIFINNSFSLSHNSTDLDFFVFVSQENLWVWRRRFTLLIGLVVGFIGFLGLVVLLEIWVWFFVGLLLNFLFFICLFGWWVYEVHLFLILDAGLCFFFFFAIEYEFIYLFIDGCLLDLGLYSCCSCSKHT